MDNTTHNGWTNYATWRVNLEWFDGMDSFKGMTAEECEELVTEHIDAQSEGLARNYAMAFLSEVNWHEIAEHLKDEEE
jgi:K+-transporting ATPase A subunit